MANNPARDTASAPRPRPYPRARRSLCDNPPMDARQAGIPQNAHAQRSPVRSRHQKSIVWPVPSPDENGIERRPKSSIRFSSPLSQVDPIVQLNMKSVFQAGYDSPPPPQGWLYPNAGKLGLQR